MMSAVKPPAPLGSLALNVMTQTGASPSSGASVLEVGVVRDVGFAIGDDFACERNSNAASIQSLAFYVKAT